MNSFIKFIAAATILSSIVVSIVSYFGLPYQVLIWEFFIDLRILVLIGIILIYQKKIKIDFLPILKGKFVFQWETNLFFFFYGFFVIILNSFVGLLFKGIKFDTLENWETILLGIVFDIPAVYFFSLSTILFEELFFRIILPALTEHHSVKTQALHSSLLWMVYSLPVIFAAEHNLIQIFLFMLYSFTTGIFLFSLSKRYQSVWISYTFRIGVVSYSTIMLSSIVIDSDTFFTAKSPYFSLEGIGVSLFLLLSALFLLKKVQNYKKLMQILHLLLLNNLSCIFFILGQY